MANWGHDETWVHKAFYQCFCQEECPELWQESKEPTLTNFATFHILEIHFIFKFVANQSQHIHNTNPCQRLAMKSAIENWKNPTDLENETR